MKNKTITITNKKYRKSERILLYFAYNDTLKNIIKQKFNGLWSSSLKCWHIDYNTENIHKIYSVLPKDYRIVNNLKKRDFTKDQKDFLNGFYKYLKGKRYSESTVKTYSLFIADFVDYYKNKNVDEYTNRDIEVYLENVFVKRNYSISTQRQFISAVKQLRLYNPSCKIDDLKLTRPKKSRKLPLVLSKEEVLILIKNTSNLKHRTIIALLYSSGLRISELLNLKVRNIDIDRKQLIIQNAKGRKDRYVVLAESIIPLLINYYHSFKPKVYFIESKAGKTYSASSVRKLLKRACEKSGIRKVVTPHTLRHSFATHLLENGISLRHIQELLGHSRPETTMIYTKVTKKDLLDVESPLDKIMLGLQKDKKEQNFLLSQNI